MADTRPTLPADESGPGPWIWLAVLVAVILRAWEALESSLWLDELHTLFHASQPSWSAVAESVQRDLHTPLFFGTVHLFGGWNEGAWLRAIPIVSSALGIFPLVAVARHIGLSRGATLLAALLYAGLPYEVLYGAELRPYAWIGLFSCCAFLLAFSDRGSETRRLASFFACVLLGLWTHRLMAITVLAIGAARLVHRKPGSVALWKLIAAGTLAVAAFLPWMFSFAVSMTDARMDYQETTGGYRLRPALVWELLSLPSRLIVPYARELGGAWVWIEIAGAVLFGFAAAAAALFAWKRLRERDVPSPSPVLRGLVIFAVVVFVLTTAFAVYSWDRAPLQYYTPMAWAIPLVVAAWVDRAGRMRELGVALIVAVLALAIGLCGGKSREDVRAAVAAARKLGAEFASERPIYTGLLAQPSLFPNTLPYLAYAPDLAAVEPIALPQTGSPDFARPVIVVRRVVALGRKEWLPITNGREQVREIEIDRYLTVYLFRAAP